MCLFIQVVWPCLTVWDGGSVCACAAHIEHPLTSCSDNRPPTDAWHWWRERSHVWSYGNNAVCDLCGWTAWCLVRRQHHKSHCIWNVITVQNMMRLCSRALEKKGAARARQTESCGAGRFYKGAGREFVAIGDIYNCHWGSKKWFTSVKVCLCVDAFEEWEFCFLNLPNALPFSFGEYHSSLGFTSSRIRREISGITHHYYPVAGKKKKKKDQQTNSSIMKTCQQNKVLGDSARPCVQPRFARFDHVFLN